MQKLAVGVVVVVTILGGRVAAESPVGLTVRLYNGSGIPVQTLAAARQVAEPILRDAGTDVVFRRCGAADASNGVADPCDDPLKPAEVVVRVIDAPPFSVSLDPRAYGVTYVVEETNRGWLATVFSDRIVAAASRIGVAPSTLLGRAIAHEVGHLLLGSGYHGDAGVMRAEWTDDFLHRDGAGEWRFSKLEAAAMQRVVASSHR